MTPEDPDTRALLLIWGVLVLVSLLFWVGVAAGLFVAVRAVV